MEKLLSTQQVADILGLHIKTLQKRLRNNDIALHFVRLSPRKIGFKPSVLETYIDTHEIRLDGRGLKKTTKQKTRIPAPYMTNAEAQAFFEGIARDEDGVLVCKDED